MTYHILNGDCLFEQIKQANIGGELIVCRECLIDGPVKSSSLDNFWNTRATYISSVYQENTTNYYDKVVTEVEKLNHLPPNAKVCLWFENDLFCQANMWFILSILAQHKHQRNIYRVFPTLKNKVDLWKGFGMADADMLEQAYANKVLFQQTDMQLGKDLWEAYQENDYIRLTDLSLTQSDSFQYLPEVCQAHIDRFPTNNQLGRPERLIAEIIKTKTSDFVELFQEFFTREGIYGFGDLQVKRMYDGLIAKN